VDRSIAKNVFLILIFGKVAPLRIVDRRRGGCAVLAEVAEIT
jgi:hypothetical protein